MPIWLGVQGEQVGLRMVAELADGWNFSGADVFDEFGPKLDVLQRHADAVGPGHGARSRSRPRCGSTGTSSPEARERAFAFVSAGVQHLILYLDGRQGPEVVDLVASEIVAPLARRVRVGSFTRTEIDLALERSMVRRTLALLRLRRTHSAFRGRLEVETPRPSSVRLTWSMGLARCTLDVGIASGRIGVTTDGRCEDIGGFRRAG